MLVCKKETDFPKYMRMCCNILICFRFVGCVYQSKVNVQAKLPSYVIKHHAKQVLEV